MSYKEKPQLKLYTFTNNQFILQAIIDDYQECSFEDNLYDAGQFSVTINFNIPNSQLFQRGLFIQFGNSWKFGEITKIQDQIDENGKGGQFRIITGYDARYILKRRVIKNMNSNGLWVMSGKGEIVLRNLINDQCGTNAENKRKLPIVNTIPTSENAIGKEYSASEQFSNLYEICKTIATQSEIGWRLEFDGTSLNLVCFEGTDRTQTVQFSTSFDSLSNGEFIDSSESFSNAIYVGGKGQNDDRDIYEGESAIEGNSPSGLDRYESWDNQSSMTTESEYETEALSMLNQYGQTLTMSGNGLAKCPYEYEKEYFVGDKIKIAFSGKSANAQILSVTEYWSFGAYEINFSFGKPLPDLNAQLQLILKQIQKASNKTNSTDSVRWYTIPTDTQMPSADVTYNTIGFVGDVGSGATFTLYLDNEKTGAKTYHVWFKQLGGSGKLTLTTGKSGAVDLSFGGGTYVAIISVDEAGNIVNVASTPTNTIAVGNNQPATSDGVAQAINNAESSLSPVDVVQSGNMKAVTSNAVAYNNITFETNYLSNDANNPCNIFAIAESFADKIDGSQTIFCRIGGETVNSPYGTANTDFHYEIRKISNSQNVYIQISAYDIRSNEVYHNTKVNGSWGTWKCICDSSFSNYNTVDDLLNFELYNKHSTCSGGIYIQTSTLGIPATWYHFLWIPLPNNLNYGKLFLYPLWNNGEYFYIINRYYDDNQQGPVNQPARTYGSIATDNFYQNDIRVPTSGLMYNKFAPTTENILDKITNKIGGTWQNAQFTRSGGSAQLFIKIVNPQFTLNVNTYDIVTLGVLPVGYRPKSTVWFPVQFEGGQNLVWTGWIDEYGNINIGQWGTPNSCNGLHPTFTAHYILEGF